MSARGVKTDFQAASSSQPNPTASRRRTSGTLCRRAPRSRRTSARPTAGHWGLRASSLETRRISYFSEIHRDRIVRASLLGLHMTARPPTSARPTSTRTMTTSRSGRPSRAPPRTSQPLTTFPLSKHHAVFLLHSAEFTPKQPGERAQSFRPTDSGDSRAPFEAQTTNRLE